MRRIGWYCIIENEWRFQTPKLYPVIPAQMGRASSISSSRRHLIIGLRLSPRKYAEMSASSNDVYNYEWAGSGQLPSAFRTRSYPRYCRFVPVHPRSIELTQIFWYFAVCIYVHARNSSLTCKFEIHSHALGFHHRTRCVFAGSNSNSYVL